MSDVKFKYSLNVAINVRQRDKAVNFYEKVLGLGLVSMEGADSCGIEMSAGPLALWIDNCKAEEEEHVGKVFFEFETNTLEGARELLQNKGVKIMSETSGENFKGFMAQDPYGMRFHVFNKIT